MKPWGAWGTALILALLTWAALAANWLLAGALLGVAIAISRRRTTLLVLAASAATVNGFLLGWLSPAWDWQQVQVGAIGGMRVAAVVAVNVTVLDRLSLPAWLDGLRLGRRATGFLAAVVLAAHDVASDFQRIKDVKRLDGNWPQTRLAGWREAAQTLPHLLLLAWRRGQTRVEALRLVGLDVGHGFAPVVAVTALAVAGRLAFIAWPNLALTYVVVFAGGLLFGSRVGALAGMASMALTNLMLSGFAPVSFVNVPAMALVGLAGGWFQRVGGPGQIAWAASAGIVATLSFSVVADATTWFLIAELRQSADLLKIRILAGLVFNVPAAIANGVLFALLIGPLSRARTVIQDLEQAETPQQFSPFRS